MNCAVLAMREDWFLPFLLACPGLGTFALEGPELPSSPASRHLPRIARPDIVVLTPGWFYAAAAQGRESLERAFSRLRSVSRAVVGFEGHDAFRLWMPPEAMERLDLLVKAQGVYRDRGLYNHDVGPIYSDCDWTAKTVPSSRTYTPRQLDKLRLSLPCFLSNHPVMRHRARRAVYDLGGANAALRRIGDAVIRADAALLGPFLRRTGTAHCLISLTHLSRVRLLELLHEAGIRGEIGAADITECVGGTLRPGEALTEETSHQDGFIGRKTTADRIAELRRGLERSGLLRRPIDRLRFYHSILRHDAVIAPTGFGELTTRHADAWAQGRALICPDLTHAQTMFPFESGRNVIYCRPDFADIVDILRRVEDGRIDHRAISRQGRKDWLAWTSDIDAVLDRGIAAHLREALS